jgi:hypothetical protein
MHTFSRILPILHVTKDAKSWEIMKSTASCSKRSEKDKQWRRRRSGRPARRWEDFIVKGFGTEWRNDLAKIEAIENRKNMRKKFIKTVCSCMNFATSKLGFSNAKDNFVPTLDPNQTPKEKVHNPIVFTDFIVDRTSNQNLRFARLSFCVDNETVGKWVNGFAKCEDHDMLSFVKISMNTLHYLHAQGHCVPSYKTADYVRHVFREKNVYADDLSKRALKSCALVKFLNLCTTIFTVLMVTAISVSYHKVMERIHMS